MICKCIILLVPNILGFHICPRNGILVYSLYFLACLEVLLPTAWYSHCHMRWRCGHVVGGTQWNKDLAQQLPSSAGTQHGFALPPAIHCLSQTKRSDVFDIADLSCTPTYQTLKHPILSESLQKTKQNRGGGKKKQGARGQHIGRRSVNSELLSQEEIHKMC